MSSQVSLIVARSIRGKKENPFLQWYLLLWPTSYQKRSVWDIMFVTLGPTFQIRYACIIASLLTLIRTLRQARNSYILISTPIMCWRSGTNDLKGRNLESLSTKVNLTPEHWQPNALSCSEQICNCDRSSAVIAPIFDWEVIVVS